MGEVVEVRKYYPGNYGAPGQKRQPKRKPTPEDVKKVNERRKKEKVWRLILMNFKAGDWHLILRYAPRDRPGPEEAKRHLRDFHARMRRELKKAGRPYKYIAVTEIGERGGVHHHLIIEGVPGIQEIVKASWREGSTFWADLYDSEDGFEKLADYLVKKETKERVPGSSYTASRNLVKPEPVIEDREFGTWRKEPKPKKGYYIIKDSLVNGHNPITGRPFQRYVMKRLPPGRHQRNRERGEPDG